MVWRTGRVAGTYLWPRPGRRPRRCRWESLSPCAPLAESSRSPFDDAGAYLLYKALPEIVRIALRVHSDQIIGHDRAEQFRAAGQGRKTSGAGHGMWWK